MVSPGDTITYTASSGERVSEDISIIDEIKIEYVDGAAGEDGDGSGGGNGGRVESVIADVESFNELFIWVADGSESRYDAQDSDQIGFADYGAGSATSEVSITGTDVEDSDTEPFIAASGGGGGGWGSGFAGPNNGEDGARGGDADGIPPPEGGEGALVDEGDGDPGKGAISGHGSQVPIIDTGTTVEGGGSTTTEGEIRISYEADLEPPEPPESLKSEIA